MAPTLDGKHVTPSACLDVARKGRGCAMGYTMLTRIDGSEVRYTEWVYYRGPTADWKPDWGQNYGTELYNHSVDPAENQNIFTALAGSAAAMQLKQRLHRGWAGSMLPGAAAEAEV